MGSTTAALSFPVPLVCPSCGSALKFDAACACPAATRLESWCGMPRLLFGQSYWGECSSEKMAAILRRMDSVPWKQALEEVVPNEPVQEHLTSSIGPDFVYGLPWDEIRTVLDVGSGMGLMTALLARHAKTVIAVEAVPERALFQSKRAAQDGFRNWHPIVADATALPFAPETFDLITLNGVFEYIGLRGKGAPEVLQQRFLENALRLLKPDGYLYVGIENRFGLGMILGGRDHSGLAFTSLMPRRLADWYCRKRGVNFYGSDHSADGYRTYTYAPQRYPRMFRAAGFASVDVYGVFDGYNRQKAVYRMGDADARRATRELVNPPASWKGRLRRDLENARPLYQILENEVVVFGRKSAANGPLFWPSLPHDGPVTQFSSSDKVFGVCFDGGPASVFKTAKTDEAVPILEKEYDFLRDAERRHGDSVRSWPLRWPKPLGARKRHGRSLFQYEFARGLPLSNQLLPVSFDLDRFGRLLGRLIDGYIELCGRMTAAQPAAPSPAAWGDLLDRLAAVRVDDAACAERIRAAIGRLRPRQWATGLAHGDLSLGNTMMAAEGSMILVDWENAAFGGFAAIDLLRLLYDVWDESSLLKPRSREAVMERTRRAVGDALGRVGIGPEDYDDVEALFIAHQFQQWISREHDLRAPVKVRELLRRYREREAALA
ncbi:MAG: methyltransferase domain-containing protein [Elusimicrobiota bacterium]